MLDLVGGLPVHVLVVHAVVVLLPLSALGAVVAVLARRWRRVLLPVVAGLAVAGAGLTVVASQSGEALMVRVGPPAGDHQALGGLLVWVAGAFAVLLVVLVVLDRVRAAPPALTAVVAALVLVAAVVTVVQVYRVGDSGARSVWADVVATAAGPAR